MEKWRNQGNVVLVGAFAAFLGCLAISATCQAQEIRFVDGSADVDGDGLSWRTAYDNLIAALDEAAANPSIEQIWVAQGAYTPDRGQGNRSDSFELVGGVGVFGGFVGDEDQLDQRNPEKNVTTLSGDFNGDDGPNFINNDDNARQVVTAMHLIELATLDGFTVTGGNADFDPGDLLGGGGVYSLDSNVRIANSRLIANAAGILNNTIGGFGGAVFVNGGDATIENTRLEGNRSNNGGALGVWVFEEAAHHVEVIDCQFVDNLAIGLGGAAWTAHNPLDDQTDRSVRFIGCLFENNSAVWAGAIIEQNTPLFEVSRCAFIGNHCDLLGGAMKISTTAGPDADPARIKNCLFLNNESDAPGSISFGGGAVSFEAAKGHFVNCVFLGNHTDGPGGAIRSGNIIGFGGGAMELFVHNCLFSGNTADSFGGAIVLDDNPLAQIINSTLVNNSSGAGGGGVSSFANFLDIDNTILWSNDVLGQQNEAAQVQILQGGFNVDHTIVQGLTGAFGGEGNSGDDPLFVSALGEDGMAGTEDDNARLQDGSPARDAGDEFALPNDELDVDDDGDVDEVLPIDLDGNDRIADPNVDMGAYEVIAGGALGDIDGDGVVGTSDLLLLLGAWGDCPPKGDCPADLDDDGAVGTTDLLILLGNWGPCPK